MNHQPQILFTYPVVTYQENALLLHYLANRGIKTLVNHSSIMSSNHNPIITKTRLVASDVKAIFSSIANDKPPPALLRFKIIRVPCGGLKLAPPPLELPQGIYVLLRSSKDNPAQIPSSLTSTLLTESELDEHLCK